MPRSTRRSRLASRLEGRRLALEATTVLGQRVRTARRARKWSQSTLAARIGHTAQRVSQIERGHGHAAPLEIWFALSHALNTPLRVEMMRDALGEPVDAGHLRLQELLLRLGRETGRGRHFELPTKPANPAHSVDVCLCDDTQRILLINECWNTIGNVNASMRSTHRKAAEAEALAISLGGEQGPYRVAACWVVHDTRANRALVARYPEVFAAAFAGPSAGWIRALTTRGVAPPRRIGLVWADLGATRLFARRATVRSVRGVP